MLYYLQRGSEMKQTQDAALVERHKRKGWIENPPPAYDAATQSAPEWKGGQWVITDKTIAPAPEATPLQVCLWLKRTGIDPESIPAYIAEVTEEGAEREEVLMRWNKTLSFPKNHPLVVKVAAQLNRNLDEVWDSILAIE